jgi:dipeptidyl aminopeptidase/acylaminoacyl peptidase
MVRCHFLPAALLLLVPLGGACAQETLRTHDITIDDYFSMSLLTASAIAPDGKHVAYSEARWQKSTGDRKSDLWIVDTKTPKPRKLTFDRCNPRNIVWSGDGKAIYFLANRKRDAEKHPPFDGKTQVWRLTPAGAFDAVTEVEGGVEAFALAGDGRHLFYVTHYDHVEDEWKGLREKFSSIDYGHGINKVSRVWKLDLESWRTEKIVDAKRFIYEIAVTPDAQKLAMITAPDDRVVHFEGKSRVDVFFPANKGTVTVPDKIYRVDHPSPYAWIEHLAWSHDGTHLAFNAIWDGYPAEIVVAEWKGKEVTSAFLPRLAPTIHGYGSPLAFRGRSSDVAYLNDNRGRVWLWSHSDADSKWTRWLGGDHVVSQFSFDAAGELVAAVVSSSTQFPDVYVFEASGEPRRLTTVNPQVGTWKLPGLSIATWKGTNGDAVEGILELPFDYQPGQKVPLVVDLHGGPTTAYYYERMYHWFSGRTLLPAKGYAVLCPNYRGSTGYGDKFLIDLVGKENDWDVQDILKGVDALVEKGIADPQKLAVMGWSNGGYLTNCCITATDRFKAAISGAGIIDAVMEFGANDEPAYSLVFKRGFPWTSGNTYVKASPSWQLNKIKTPTLIHVGANDDRCPPGHSKTLYRALKEYNKVPTELLVYPGAQHGLRQYNHIQGKLEWDLAWLSRFVLGKKK